MRKVFPENGYVKLYVRALHLPFSTAFLLTLNYHVAQKMRFL